MACILSKCILPNLFIPILHHRRNQREQDPKNAVSPDDILSMKASSFLLRFCILQCGRQSVQVLQPDGRMIEYRYSILAGHLLRAYPHHYLCNAADAKGAILPLDATLELGNIYLLLPVPRLFPTLASSSSCSCSCYSGLEGCRPKSSTEAGLVGLAPLRGTFPWSHKGSKVSPEGKQGVIFPSRQDDSGAITKSQHDETMERNKEVLVCRYIASKAMKSWKPKLQSISEDHVFVYVEEHDKFPATAFHTVSSRPKHRPQHFVNTVRKASEQHMKISWSRDSRLPLLSANPLFIF